MTPDPLSPSKRGVPWIYPVLRDLFADTAATRFKQAFFDNGATPSLIISIDKSVIPEKWREWIKIFKEKHEGARNAFKTLYLGAGATATVVGSSFDKLDFRNLAANTELRVCAAAGVPSVLVGLSGGSNSSSLGSTSDYPAARRRFADATVRPNWRNFFGSLETIVPPPPGSQLWYDDSDIPFLREDVKDSAEIDQIQAQTIVALIRDGFDPDEAVAAVTSGDLTQLKGKHNGFISVQQQPIAFPGSPGTGATLVQSPPPPAQLGPGEGSQAVTRDVVLAARAELEAAGRDAGYDTLARRFGVSSATIRRRLSAGLS